VTLTIINTIITTNQLQFYRVLLKFLALAFLAFTIKELNLPSVGGPAASLHKKISEGLGFVLRNSPLLSFMFVIKIIAITGKQLQKNISADTLF